MSKGPKPLTPAERSAIAASLTQIRDRLDSAGELLAAVHITNALDCLAPDTAAQN
jgi:selenophosphate synthase